MMAEVGAEVGRRDFSERPPRSAHRVPQSPAQRHLRRLRKQGNASLTQRSRTHERLRNRQPKRYTPTSSKTDQVPQDGGAQRLRRMKPPASKSSFSNRNRTLVARSQNPVEKRKRKLLRLKFLQEGFS